MKALKSMAASLLDGLAGLLEWPSRALRKLASAMRGGGPGEEDEK